jgi:predicted nucleic acid-binding protein
MRVLFDTNVVLDLLLKREPWQAVDAGRLTAYLPASAVTEFDRPSVL